MSAPEQLARLTAGTTWPDDLRARDPATGISRDTEGYPGSLTARGRESRSHKRPLVENLEVAQALSGLDGGPYYLGRVLFLDDLTSIPALREEAYRFGLRVARRLQWPRLTERQLRGMMGLALFEVLSPRVWVCQEFRADEARIPRRSWFRTWSIRYETELRAPVALWPDVVLQHVRRRLR